MSLGKMWLSACLAEGAPTTFIQQGQIDDLFKGNEKKSYEFVKDFVKAYGSLPTPETIEAHTGETLPPAKEPAQYYFDLLQQRHIEISLKQSMQKSAALLGNDIETKNPQGALETLTETIMGLIVSKNTRLIADFRDAYDLIIPDYAQKWKVKDDYGLMLGWPTFDEMTGGITKGDLVSFVGRPQKGKTWQMLYAAHHGWKASALKALEAPEKSELASPPQSRLFVSMEMPILQIEQRLASLHLSLPADHVKKAELSSQGLKKLKTGLTEIKGYGAPFWVMDGNLAAQVEDIWMLARQLKPDAIFIDGAYLLKHPSERDRFRRVAENADLLKSELSPLAPTVASWQFARGDKKKKKVPGEKTHTLDDIGYTDAIAQVSSIVVGLFEEETVENLMQRVNEILKGRAGEIGSFKTKWDFVGMDFSEISETAVEDLNFL